MAVAGGSAMFGLFWVPLRFLDSNGITGLWAVSLVMLVTTLPALLVLKRRMALATLCHYDTWLIGSALGLSSVLYFIGVIHSDIIRVIFLFYLLPVWTTLAAFFLYKEPIHRLQIVIILLALIGLWLLLGGGTEIPLPKNAGDWCGLGAGLTWGLSLAMLRGKEAGNAFATVVATSTIGGIIGLIALAALPIVWGNNSVDWPEFSKWYLTIPLIFGFAALCLFPAYLGQIWGAQRIPAPTAALLTMSEIVVATLSAWLLIGTELNRVSIIGALIIVTAALCDIGYKHHQSKLLPA